MSNLTSTSKLAPQMSLTQLPLWRDCRGGVAIEGIPVDCTRFLTLPHLLLLLILCTGFALAAEKKKKKTNFYVRIVTDYNTCGKQRLIIKGRVRMFAELQNITLILEGQ